MGIDDEKESIELASQKTTYNTDHLPISDWFTKIKNSKVVLPKFQRFEAWGPSEKRKLLQSIIEGVPIGSLLLLGKGGELDFDWRSLTGAQGKEKRIESYLLDGQQRLTTLWRSFKDDYERDVFFIKIRPDEKTDPDDLPLVIRKRRWTKNGKTYPLWTFKPKHIHERGLIPLSLVDPSEPTKGKEWIKEIAEDKDEETSLIIDEDLDGTINNIQKTIGKFEVPFIKLDSSTPPDMVITTFRRINEEGTKLSTYDLMVAKMAKVGEDLHDRAEKLKEEVPAFVDFMDVDDLDILRGAVLLQGKKPTQNRILSIDPEYFIEKWDELVRGCEKSLSFLREEGIFDKKRLPSRPVLPLLFALWGKHISYGGEKEGMGRELMKDYIWRTFFSDHLAEGSTNTLVTNDFIGLKKYLKNEIELDEIPYREGELPSQDRLLNAGWPKNKDRLARAILALSLKEGGLDIYSGEKVTSNNIGSRHYHHLFPKAYLKDQGYESDDIDKSLNVALITPKTNLQISGASPKDYLLKITDSVEIDEGRLKDRLESHLIPYEPFIQEDYERFLKERANLIQKKLEKVILNE